MTKYFSLIFLSPWSIKFPKVHFKIFFLASLVMPLTFISAQIKDSVPQKITAYYADKFAIARPLNIEFNQFTPYKFSSENLGNYYADGKVGNSYQVKVSVNGNFIAKKSWMLGVTLNYNYTSARFEMNHPDGTIRLEDNDFLYHSTSLNFTYVSKLWEKPLIYTASTVVDGSEKHFERVKGIATATMLLRANANTKIAIGLVGIIDPSTQIPVLPTFIYEHKFGNGWSADLILPKRLFLLKNISKNNRISVGTELGGTSFYLYDLFETDEKYEFRQLEINSGIIYEHHIGGSFLATFKTGIKSIPNSRIFKKSESFDSYIFEVNPKPIFYFNIGLSFNPFGGLFK